MRMTQVDNRFDQSYFSEGLARLYYNSDYLLGTCLLYVWHTLARYLLDLRDAAGNRINVALTSMVNNMNVIILVI